MRYKRKFISGFLLALMIFISPIGMFTVDAQEKTIKVGYDSNSKFIQEKNKEYYGYGVEYLNKISEYTDWKYEYVNDESWQESFDKLRNGEIDLICTVHYTKERAEEFIYSEIPLGYETTLLYANTDSEISYKDYEAFNDCKVGLLMESYSAVEFEEYAKEMQIAYEPVYYERDNDMQNALKNGEIDLLVIGSRYGTTDLRLVDRLGANAFYCIARKENVRLIENIESVLQQIMFDDPMFEGILNKKYFGHNSLSNTPIYTKEELAYIESLGIIKIKMLMNQRPSCYEEDGEIKGIWAGYIDLISKKSGIRFEMETGTFDQNSDDIYRNLMEDNYLVLRTDKAIAFNPIDDVIVSSPLMDVEVSYIKRQEEIVTGGFTNYIIALPPELSYVEPVLLEENPSYEIEYYKNAESCMDAVINKKATMAIINTFRASYLLQKPKYADKLAEVPGTGYSNRIHLMANKENAMLISVINKAIIHISSEEKEEIVTKELLMHPYVVGFDDIWYSYWEWIVGIIALVFISLYIYVVMTRKVTKLQFEKKEYEMLQKKIQLDELTGLYNRTFFYQIVKEKIEQSEEEMCIISVDISNFKVVNELYGESVGDGLLKEVAQNLKKLDVDNKMIIARFMSDHYYICLPKSEFNKIHLPKKFETSLEDMEVRVVYGIFFAELHSEMLISVMCDRALLAAHDKNNNYLEYIHLYNNEKHKYIMAEQEIENDMEKALSNKQFYIVIQPKFNPRTRKIVGGESLVRWKHPVKGTVSPSIFVKVFEKNGFIIHLDYYVWEETCRLLSKWKQEGKDVIPLSINVSRAHFYGNDLKDKLTELVLKYGLDTKDLELEITESLCGEDPGIIYAKIRQLQDMGFKIAMDDFGSGYSSLNMLKEMPLDIIKMDLKFLDGEKNKSRLILKSLITMAQAMELKVVVEGVENLPQVEFLAQFKDCSLQGYYFSRPVITSEFEHLLENN